MGFGLGLGGWIGYARWGGIRVKENGEWKEIYGELRKGNPLQGYCDRLGEIAGREKKRVAWRSVYFDDSSEKAGSNLQEMLKQSEGELAGMLRDIIDHLTKEAAASRNITSNRASSPPIRLV